MTRGRPSYGHISSTSVCAPLIYLWLFVLLADTTAALAQDTDDTSNQFWFAYQYERRLGEHSRFSGSLGLEELLSSGLLLGDWSRYYLTGAASHDLSRHHACVEWE